MDLLKTILVYMSMVVAASVQNAPDPGAPAPGGAGPVRLL